jgi:hypothetical protein
MYQIGEIIVIIGNNIELTVEIIKINLDGTYSVLKDDGTMIRIYREDIKG